jgi:dephospho-CoA kinase
MRVIGITGGVGAGKSTVLALLEKNFNAYILMADDIAKQTYEPGQDGYGQIVEMFGEDILSDDKTIDRAKLADIVFENNNKRIVLNSIVHPLVKKKVIEEIAKKRAEEKYDYIFLEAALLIEDHYDVICDEIWYIDVPEEMRRERLRTSRGYSDEKIDGIFKSQLDREAFEKYCSHTIDNSKDINFTLRQLEKLLLM